MIISQTPLRISFAGGGTDLKSFYSQTEGSVLSTAIDKYIYVVIKERFDKKIRVGYTKTEMVDKIDEVQHDLVREALRKTNVTEGIEITTMADIPSQGSGLGSSSTLTVGLLNALYSYKGELKTKEELAREACAIEINILKRPIGKQDQYIAAYGGMRIFKFKQDESVEVKTIDLPFEEKERLNSKLLLFYTGITRNSESILSEQNENTINDKEKFQTLEKMKETIPKLEESLNKNFFNDFGQLLHQNWMYKKELASKISNEEIDQMYNKARKSGAIGGKLSGAGGGGFLLIYVDDGNRERVLDAMNPLKPLRFKFERDGSKIIFNIRR